MSGCSRWMARPATNSLTSQVISDFHWAPNGKTLARRRQSGSVRTVTWAASTSRKRSRELPCLLMWPSRRRSPLDSSHGRQQQDMRNRGFVFAVIDGSAETVVSLHKTQARAEAVADLHNERDSNQKWLG